MGSQVHQRAKGLLFLAIALASTLFANFCSASPISLDRVTENPAYDLLKRYDTRNVRGCEAGPGEAGPSTSPYPNDDAIIAAFQNPQGRPFVFWTELDTLGSPAARDFARTGVYQGQPVNGLLVDECFEDPNFLCTRPGDGGWGGNYIDRFSGIFADRSGVTVFLVTEAYDQELTRACSVFLRVEAPSLMQHMIQTVVFVDAHDFTRQKSVNLATLLARFPQEGSISKRDGTQLYGCNNWVGYGNDPHGSCPSQPDGPKFSAGQCGVHIIQSRNESPPSVGPSTPLWSLDITLLDDNRVPVGTLGIDAEGGSSVDVTGALPYVFILQPGAHGNGDDDPIDLKYGDWSEQTKAPACSVGKYDGGKRQMDCGFRC